MPLSDNDIMAELSYAILHAIAAKAGFACEVAGRHSDHMGIDARVIVKERFTEESVLTEFALDVQLKATARPLLLQDDVYSFSSLTRKRYDKLRRTDIAAFAG